MADRTSPLGPPVLYGLTFASMGGWAVTVVYSAVVGALVGWKILGGQGL